MKLLVVLLPFVFLSVACGDESVNNYIRAILENFKSQMPTGIPDMGVPVLDPLSVPTINERIHEGQADIKILVDNLKIDGMSKFETQSLNADMQNLRLSLSLFIPRVAGNGYYDLNGKVFNIIPLYGKGKASVQLIDLNASATAALTITNDGHLKLNEFDIEPSFGSISVNLENILGGGSLGKVVNGVINLLGKNIFDKFKPDIRNGMNKALIGVINGALAGVKLSDIQGGLIPSRYNAFSMGVSYEAGNANSMVDGILSIARPTIEKRFDPLDLPNESASFSKKVLGITFYGEAKVDVGWLTGFDTIHRSGDAEMSESGDQLTAQLEVNDLQGHYRASAKFMDMGPETGVTLKVSSVSVKFTLTQVEDHLELDEFHAQVGDIDVKFESGLGPLDWMLSNVINLINKLVKGVVVNLFDEKLKQLIDQELHEITLPNGK